MQHGPRQPLPIGLGPNPFTVAEARAVGLGQGRLRGRDLQRPFRGVRVPRGSDELVEGCLPLPIRAASLLIALPDGAFLSHLTAAELWPLPLPRWREGEAIHVSLRSPARAPRRPGVVGHHVHDPRTTAVVRAGLPMVDPATLFCQLAPILRLDDLVAVGDALVLEPVYQDWNDDRPWVPLEHLSERVDLFRGRGKVSARTAARLIRPGAESRPETLLRLAIVRAGLPEPEVNVNIHDAEGRFLGRADLVYRRWRVIVEYDGDQHRTDTRQFDRDVLRLEGFATAGWTVVRVSGRSFFGERQACLSRIRRALSGAGWHG